MRTSLLVSLLITFMALIAAIYFLNLGGLGNNGIDNNEAIALQSKEIKEYQGEKLSSVTDFRENSIKGVQYIDINAYKLRVYGLVGEEKEYTYDEVINRQSYSKVITLHCVEGWDATILWEGIILRELLEESKPLPEANTIIFHAVDGYTSNYPIGYIMDQDILMAYKMNNETIIPARGFPFQLVAEDKWGYKWIKWITDIEFSDDEDYEGFWESRGYSKEGYLNESFVG